MINIRTNSRADDVDELVETIQKKYANNTFINFDSRKSYNRLELISLAKGKYSDAIYKYELYLETIARESRTFLDGNSLYDENYFKSILDRRMVFMNFNQQMRYITRIVSELEELKTKNSGERYFSSWREVKYGLDVIGR